MTRARNHQVRRLALDERGTSLLEVIVTTGIIGLLLGGSVLGIKSTYNDLGNSSQTFASDVRLARMDAVTRGVHFRVAWDDRSYRTERLEDLDGNGVWETDIHAQPQTRALPAGITIATASGDQSRQAVEFDTRGMVVAPLDGSPDLVVVGITAAPHGGRIDGIIDIEIWPSGQIYLLARAAQP